jgi:hypothetical protein
LYKKKYIIKGAMVKHNIAPAGNKMHVPATTPFILRSFDNLSTNCRGDRDLTFENSTWYSRGTTFLQ